MSEATGIVDIPRQSSGVCIAARSTGHGIPKGGDVRRDVRQEPEIPRRLMRTRSPVGNPSRWPRAARWTAQVIDSARPRGQRNCTGRLFGRASRGSSDDLDTFRRGHSGREVRDRTEGRDSHAQRQDENLLVTTITRRRTVNDKANACVGQEPPKSARPFDRTVDLPGVKKTRPLKVTNSGPAVELAGRCGHLRIAACQCIGLTKGFRMPESCTKTDSAQVPACRR